MGLYRDNGKENGNYYNILGLYRDNGKENGNYYNILGLYRDNGKENGNYHLGFRVLGFGLWYLCCSCLAIFEMHQAVFRISCLKTRLPVQTACREPCNYEKRPPK